MRFVRVDIRYTDGDPFYSGWIQDFGDGRTGPTFFSQNYSNYGLEYEIVHQRLVYWDLMDFESEDVIFRDATEDDLDAIIDLNFQNYFEGGYNRISAYQGINFKITDTNSIIVCEIDGLILGFLYIDWSWNSDLREAYFDSLYCAPAVRNRGLAHKLIEFGILQAVDRGIQRISGKINGDLEHCEKISRILMQHGFEIVEAIQMPGWIAVETLKLIPR